MQDFYDNMYLNFPMKRQKSRKAIPCENQHNSELFFTILIF